MLTKGVTYWLAKDSQPEYAVEKPGFKCMLKVFNPRYECPSRNYFSRIAIPKLFVETYDRIKHTLSGSEVGFFSATTDLWTSCAKDPFLSYTVHYISPDWESKSICLCTHYIVEDHTGENLKVSLLEIFEEWNLTPDHQVAITTDSGSNIKLACRLLGWKRLPCFAHNLDLAITKGLRDSSIEEVLQVCRKVVSKFSQSWKRTRDLAISQRDNELPLHKLKVDCATRWGSTYDMISRIAEQQKAICIVLASDRRCISLLSSLDFESIDSMISVLKPLRELTDILAAEKRVSISAVKPLVQRICNKMLESDSKDTDLAKDMKARIKCDLLRRYDDPEVDRLLSLCSFVDPHFKRRLSEEDRLAAISMVKKELLEMDEAENHE